MKVFALINFANKLVELLHAARIISYDDLCRWRELAKVGYGVSFYVKNIEELRSIRGSNGMHVHVQGYYAPGDGGGGDFWYNSDNVAADNGGTVIGNWIRISEGYISPEMFGAKGDNVADDTYFISLASSVGRSILFGRGRSYKITDTVTFENNIINLNESTINFVGAEGVTGIMLKSNVSIGNGSVNNNSTYTSSDGVYGTAITVGEYINIEYTTENVKISNLSLKTNVTNGNTLSVFGRVKNVAIDNIVFPNSSAKYGIVCHWGMKTATPSEGTYHPNNISIKNILFNTFTNTSADSGCIAISGCNNVSISNVSIDEVYEKGIFAFCGDYSFTYDEESSVDKNKNISIENVQVKKARNYGFLVVGVDLLSVVNSVPVYFKNCVVKGMGIANSRGFNFDSVKDVTVANSFASHFEAGFVDGGNTDNITLERCVAQSNTSHGFWLEGIGGSKSKRWKLLTCRSLDNNTANSASRSGVYIENQISATVDRCYINNALAAFGVRLGTGAEIATITNNIVENALTVGYSNGSATIYTTLQSFKNNTAINCAINIGGMSPIIVETHNGNRIMIADFAPVSGSWTKGDTVINNQPSTGGYSGWRCVTSGSPGTWKGYGVIQA